MEYLPEKKRTQQAQIIKHERKIHDFRQYLCDSEVVLAIVKYLIAVRSQGKLPEDPQQHMLDYFGNQRSPMWDVLEDVQEENAAIQEDLPKMVRQIAELEVELAAAKRKTQCVEIHRGGDLSNVGMKAVVQKLTGDAKAKFELDHKMSADQFSKLVLKMATPQGEEDAPGQLDAESFDKYCSAFQKALCEGGEPFKGDLENETYKNILAGFRAFDPNAE